MSRRPIIATSSGITHFCCSCALIITATAVAVAGDETYRIGGLAITGAEAFISSFGPTFSTYLNETVGKIHSVGFVAVPLTFDDVWDAVATAAVDFLFLNPSYASCMESEFGVSAVLSLRNFRQGNELSAFGGVLITAADRTDITEIIHIKDKVVEGVSITLLGAFQLQWGLLKDNGINLMVDPSEVRLAYNQNKIVYDVISGSADVGFVRTDMVEGMDADGKINMTDVKFVQAREDIAASGFPFPSSTDLVPEWPLQAMPHVPIDIVKAVMGSLMELNATHEAAISGRYSTWDPPLSYSSLSFLQVQLGFLDYDARRCLQAENVYGAVACPEGYFKLSEARVNAQCSDLGRTCPDGYTCLCRPCELIPDVEYSLLLEAPGGGVCETMRTCAQGILAQSVITLRVTDNWGSARQTLGISFAEVLELHLVTAGEDLACYTPEGGRFDCIDSTINGGNGAPALNATTTALAWEHYFTLQVNTSGSIVLRVIADGTEVDASPTLLDVIERSCGAETYATVISDCHTNASASVHFGYMDEWESTCEGYVDLPDSVYDLGCDYAPWASTTGLIASGLSITTAGVTVLLIIWTVRHRKAKPVVAAQWIFCLIFSIGVAVVALAQLLSVGRPTTLGCSFGPMVINLGSAATVSSLFVKMWRVRAVWKAGMRKIKMGNCVLFRYLALLMAIDVVLLLAMCIVNHGRLSITSDTEIISGAPVDLERVVCDYGDLNPLNWAMSAYHAIIAGAGCATSFSARNLGSDLLYMETQLIAVAAWVAAFILSTLPIISLTTVTDIPATSKVLFTSVATNATAVVSLICIFGPQIAWVHFMAPDQARVHPAMASPHSSAGAHTKSDGYGSNPDTTHSGKRPGTLKVKGALVLPRSQSAVR